MTGFAGKCGYAAVLVFLLCSATAIAAGSVQDPAVYLNFNEGSGNIVLDASGHGNPGAIAGSAHRVANSGCVKALILDGNANYVVVPYTAANHPADAVTVSLWFYVNDTVPATLVSTRAGESGGYRLAFDDGNDLYWTVGLENGGDVSVTVPHENIAPRQWHHVTGTYDGETVKVYLDGVLRNQQNATGTIRYPAANSVMVGAESGTSDTPDPTAPGYVTGGIDEFRIYSRALSYGEVMDDRFRCTVVPGTGILTLPNTTASAGTPTSGSITLAPGETATKHLTFSNSTENGTWQVSVPPGSELTIRATDLYPGTYPDEWYVELKDGDTRINRAVAFPATNNAPVKGMIASGNATVLVHYFGGPARFPAGVELTFESTAGEGPAASLKNTILEYPIIVIYSASWATLIALIVVIFWVHRRHHKP